MRRALLPSVFAALAAFAAMPSAASAGIRANMVDPKAVKIDGVPKEWSSGMVPLSKAVRGKIGKPDLDARGLVAYDDAHIYVAADVTDDTLRPGADHVRLVIGFPGGVVHTVSLYPGKPGKSPGSVRLRGKRVTGAKIVEAPTSDGYTLEASIPWSAFSQAATLRVGLRGALFVYDADAGPAAESVAGTSTSSAYASLPPLSIEPEQALTDSFLRPKHIRGAPAFNLVANVAGNALKERVLVWERYLLVLGPGFRNGTQFYYNDIEADAKAGMVPVCQTRDLTGDGQAEIILRKRFGSGGRYREMIQVLTFGSGDTPTSIFQHEIALVTEKGSVVNDVAFIRDGGKVAIRIRPGKAKGFHAGNYAEATETTFDPLLLPWGTIKSQLYKYTGGTFTKASEQKQSATAAPRSASSSRASSRAASPPSADAVLDRVHAAYKRDRGASGRPRFDFTADVAAGSDVERVLVHDRDVVVFGRGFKGGTGYAYLTLSQLTAGADIKEVTSQDVTGDGKAEILVKANLHTTAPREFGGGPVVREVMIVLQVSGNSLRRIFAAEIGRAMGRKRIIGSLRFLGAGRSSAIELAPGRAVNWTKQTYPFNQDAGPVSGFEPLLLPWGGARPVRYTWRGSGFVK